MARLMLAGRTGLRAYNRALPRTEAEQSPALLEPPRSPFMTQTPTMPSARAHKAAKRYIYAFGGGHAEGDASMRGELGGKGAGLAEMTNAGLPVPAGFTITTEACRAFYANGEKFPPGMWDQAIAALRVVEAD